VLEIDFRFNTRCDGFELLVMLTYMMLEPVAAKGQKETCKA